MPPGCETVGLLEGDWPKISNAIGRIGNAPLHIDDNPNVTVMDIRARARRMKAREGLGLVVVDYLQLMSGRVRGGEPPGGDLGDLTGAEDPREGAGDPGDCAQPAVSRPRSAF